MDDSGNVDLPTTNKADVRYGSISAVILEDAYLQETFNGSFTTLSKKHFGGREDGRPHNIHRRALTKPPAEGPFAVLRDEDRRKAWDEGCLRMLRKAQYTVVTACIDKVAWYYHFPNWEGDFYNVLVEAVLERCFYFLNNRNGVAEINIEQKNPGTDERIKAAYRRALVEGFDFISAEKLQRVFSSRELNILRKDDAIPGAQLADLVAAPALAHIRFLTTGRDPLRGDFTRMVAHYLEKHKFYREGDKGPDGYGRLWRPKPKT